jgi:hypothetical protein
MKPDLDAYPLFQDWVSAYKAAGLDPGESYSAWRIHWRGLIGWAITGDANG